MKIDEYGVLCESAKNGDLSKVRQLFQDNVNLCLIVDDVKLSGETPLSLALYHDHFNVVAYFINHCHINGIDLPLNDEMKNKLFIVANLPVATLYAFVTLPIALLLHKNPENGKKLFEMILRLYPDKKNIILQESFTYFIEQGHNSHAIYLLKQGATLLSLVRFTNKSCEEVVELIHRLNSRIIKKLLPFLIFFEQIDPDAFKAYFFRENSDWSIGNMLNHLIYTAMLSFDENIIGVTFPLWRYLAQRPCFLDSVDMEEDYFPLNESINYLQYTIGRILCFEFHNNKSDKRSYEIATILLFYAQTCRETISQQLTFCFGKQELNFLNARYENTKERHYNELERILKNKLLSLFPLLFSDKLHASAKNRTTLFLIAGYILDYKQCLTAADKQELGIRVFKSQLGNHSIFKTLNRILTSNKLRESSINLNSDRLSFTKP